VEADNKQQTFVNDAFISYSRKDKEFAARLEKALRNYKPPKGLNLARRNLVVFRDEEDFTGGEYHASLQKHLNNSRKMIVICSPHSRKSDFVNDEIRRFAQERGKENIIPVLISGIPNNEAKPEQEEEKAFPEELCKVMEMPLAASYIGFDPKKDKVNKGVFYSAWYKILADLYDISRNEIEERDRKRRRNARIAVAAVVILIFTVISYLAIYAWNKKQVADRERDEKEIARAGEAEQRAEAVKQRDEANMQRDKAIKNEAEAVKQKDRAEKASAAEKAQRILAEKRMRIAQARQLAAQSNSFRESYPERSLLLAVAGIFRTLKADGAVMPAAEESLIESLSVAGGVPMRGHESCVCSVAFSADGRRLASGIEDKTVRIWNLDLDKLCRKACETADRNLTCEEWQRTLWMSPTAPSVPICLIRKTVAKNKNAIAGTRNVASAEITFSLGRIKWPCMSLSPCPTG
jgi:hypothetical protein